MLLSRILRRLRSDDGAALASVLALMLVGALISTLILGSVIGAYAQTTQTRANVQAQASAQAGIAAATVGLQQAAASAESCQSKGGVYESTVAPRFRATVWFNGVRGCPTGAGQVKVISTGWASSPGVAGASGGDIAYLEAGFVIGMSQSSGSALYIYNSGNLNAFTVDVADPTSAGNVMVENGSVGCTQNSTIKGDIIVANGGVDITNTCHITGSIRATGQIKISSNVTVDGDVISSGAGVSLSNSTITVGGGVYANGNAVVHGRVGQNVEATGTVYLESSARVTGSVKSGGAATINGQIGGDVTGVTTGTFPQANTIVGGSVTFGGRLITVAGNTRIGGSVSAAGTGETEFNDATAKIQGNFSVGGTLKGPMTNGQPSSGATQSAKVKWYLETYDIVVGAVTYGATGLPVPSAPTPKPAPTVPGWVDWGYTESEWVGNGFTKVTWPSGYCTIGSWNRNDAAVVTLFNTIQNAVTPLVVDARSCSKVSLQDGGGFSVKADVAFVWNGFTGSAFTVSSGNGQPHKVYFLTPDGNVNQAGPQCSGGAVNSDPWGKVVIASPIAAIVYTPCQFQLNAGTAWRGQLYAASFAMSQNESLVFSPVGIPGTSLDQGSNGAQVGSLSSMETLRNRSDNGE